MTFIPYVARCLSVSLAGAETLGCDTELFTVGMRGDGRSRNVAKSTDSGRCLCAMIVGWPVPGDVSSDLDLVMLCHVVLFVDWRLVPGASDLALAISFLPRSCTNGLLELCFSYLPSPPSLPVDA